MWGGDGEAELPQAQIWFRRSSPGTLPRAEPPAAVYKAWRPDRRDEDLNPQLRSPAQDTVSSTPIFLTPRLHFPAPLSYSCPPLTTLRAPREDPSFLL